MLKKKGFNSNLKINTDPKPKEYIDIYNKKNNECISNKFYDIATDFYMVGEKVSILQDYIKEFHLINVLKIKKLI